MKRCIYCLSECNEDTQVCPFCGFNGTSDIHTDNCLEAGIRLADRYILGGVISEEKSFVSYYAFDIRSRRRVRISEYMNEKLMYRHPNEMIVKFRSEQASARADKEIAAYYTHYRKLCSVAADSVLNFTDCFAENSTVYYVSECESGTPLSSVIGRGERLALSKAAELLEPVFDACIKLEKIGKWHGSVTPYSIITADKKISLLSGYSYPPKSFYSPFDAPEKQSGVRECGSFTDVYALGAILYQATTGFMPPNPQQRTDGRNLRFPEKFPEKDKAIISKALSLDKNERYGGVAEFYAAIKGRKAYGTAPKKADTGRIAMTAVAVAVLIFSAAVLINTYIIEPFRESKQAQEFADLIQTTVEDVSTDPWVDIRAKYPDIAFPHGMNPAFADLYALNSDFAGWISVPDLDISYPVVKAADNDYYLRRDFYKNSTKYGVPFFDCRNTLDILSRNTVIYGHNMRHDDKLFGTLEQYRTSDGFRKAPLIGMSTLYGDYTFKVYAVFITNSRRDHDNGNIFLYNFADADNGSFMNFIREVDKRKLYSTGVDINENDKIITLSTCCYDFDDARLAVIGRLIRPGENPAVDTNLVSENPNPKFPQIYYDAKKIDNPYRNDVNIFNQ